MILELSDLRHPTSFQSVYLDLLKESKKVFLQTFSNSPKHHEKFNLLSQSIPTEAI